MATWDGSYAGPKEPNYYLYSDQNVAGPATDNWSYYPTNVDNSFLQTNREFYLQNEPTYDQNCPASFYRADASVPPNLLPLRNNYPQSSDNADYYLDDGKVKPQPCFAPVRHQLDQRMFDEATTSGGTSRRSGIDERSNLHATANEFVPNSSKSSKGKNKFENINYSPMTGGKDPRFDDSTQKTDPYDRTKQKRRYESRTGTNYRRKDRQYDQFQKGSVYKNSYRQQQGEKNYHKFQNEKSESRCFPDNLQEGASGGNVDATRSEETASRIDDKLVNNDNEERAMDMQQMNRARRYDNRVKEFAYQHPSSSHHRNVKKYPFNGKQVKDETSYKDVKHNYQRYNGAREYYYNKEAKTEGKEKKYSYQGYSGGYREYYSKENKSELSKDKDRKKTQQIESKDRDGETCKSKKDNSQKWGQTKKFSLVDNYASQRERLTSQLIKGRLECLVCCDYIKQNDCIWSCSNCYHVLHLNCVEKWATLSNGENGWRCPACQNVNSTIPKGYFCFCGKSKNPEWNRRDVPHSCGEICGRTLSKENCVHKCTLLCHPGSCPLCIAMVTKHCGCGKTSQMLQCSTPTLLLCDSVCGKDLECGRHKCEQNCHHGPCEHCKNTVEQECYCGKNKREVICEKNVLFTYCCNNICGKLLSCGNHTCKKLCHLDDCEPCALTPDKVTLCCCGQTPLTNARESCLDPVPICDKVCSKSLKCGQPNNPHTCKGNCHQGKCPECDLTTDVKCRCGNMDKEIACRELTTKADDARCDTRCTKKRSCGKHKCNQFCCIDIEHVCPLLCSKTLSCGRHKCEQSCHKGRCQPCWRSSFEELYCECGAAVRYPPVPCGTRRPVCDKPCSRQHSCGHEVLHNCHSEPTCPPCTVLTQRWCHGKHELRKAVACYVTEISCGLPCNKPISCGRHKCISTCHSGPCEKPGQQCTQPCTTPRELCGHICGAPCHEGKCPDMPCKEIVKVTCQCEHRSTSRVCAENSKEYQRIASSILASKMADMQLGHSINLDEVFGQGAKKQNQLKTLECNDECKVIERNRRLALGLQIVNPDLSGKLMPRYSDFMKQWAKKDAHFCQTVHEKLTELVQLAKTSKQKSRSYSFDSMNKDKRHFVHESCEHFGCESQAYDQEPKRNIVATAVKDKCWLPSYSLLEIVQRENGQRKVPGPMLTTTKADGSIKTVLSLPVRKSQKPTTSCGTKLTEPEIDYFDYQG